MAGQLRLSLLGKPEISCDGQPLTLESLSLKGEALLIYLAVTGQSASRSLLATLLWGDMPEERAKANLRLALTKLRPTLAEYLVIDRQSVAFNFDQPYWLDVAEFEKRLSTTQPEMHDQLRSAVALYRGSFLNDFYVPEAPEFEEWVQIEQERFRQMALNALSHLAEDARQRGDFKEGIQVSRQLLTIEPWLEEAHQQLMWMLAYSGQRSAALAQYEVCRRVLAEELAVEPSAATTKLYERLKQEAPESAHSQSLTLPPSSSPARPHATLPTQLTPLVGREEELTHIKRVLDDSTSHLLTLVGPGGIGKSRLAIVAVDAQQNNFSDGVGFIPLVGVIPTRADEAADLLISTIANALGYVFSAQRPPRELLLHHLAGKEMLLLLDNFEQLLPAAEYLVEILHHAPRVKLLVTSRTRLGVDGEWLFDVEGLPYPPTLESDSPAAYPAVRLFTQTATRIKPDLSLSTEQAAVNRICQIVAGFPLAIELAANWVRGLSCAEIVARLESDQRATPSTGLDILTTTNSIVAERHQSMRLVLTHSWGWLSEEEQRLFRQLSIFRGGFDLGAAEAVTCATVPLLAALVDKSWLRRDEKGDRYRVHELMRQYGAEQLTIHPGEQATTQQKHCRYYTNFLKIQNKSLREGIDKATLATLDKEIENIRAAWGVLQHQENLEAIVPFLEGLWLYYELKGWFQEAVLVFSQACFLETAPSLQKARWNRWIGEAFYQMGQLRESRSHFEQAMALLGHPMPTAERDWGLAVLKNVARQALHRFLPFAVVERSPQKRLALAEAASTLGLLGQVYYFAEEKIPVLATALTDLNLSERSGFPTELARGYATTALTCGNIPLHKLAAFYRAMAEETVTKADTLSTKAYVLEIIGVSSMGAGHWVEAINALKQSAELLDRLELRRWWDEARLLLALVAYHRGQFVHSAQGFGEALASARHRNDALAQFWGLLGLAECALRLGGIHAGNMMFFLEDAKKLPEKYLGRAEMIRLRGVLALLHLHQGNDAQARQEAQQAARMIKESNLWMLWSIEGYAAPAEVFLTLWEKCTTPTEAKLLAQLAHEGCKALHEFARTQRPGQPRAWLYQGLLHWLKGERNRASQCWYKSLAAAGQLMMPYEEGRAHYEIGRHLPASDPGGQQHLARAGEIFTQLECAALTTGRTT